MLNRTLEIALALAVLPLAGTASAKDAKMDGKPKLCKALKSIDPDNDGKLDLTEAKKAAEAAFDRINRDADKTLERKEFRGRVSKGDVQTADTDKDGTLDKAEYTAIVEKLFNAANKDRDGTLECKELKSSAGRAMMRLLRS